MKTSTARAVRFVAAMTGILAAAVLPCRRSHAEPVTYRMVTVGDAGNAPDPATGSVYGSVAYEYQIGKYEVTISQYCQFLNAVAKFDQPGGLWSTNMSDFSAIAGIARTGVSGSFSYTVIGDSGDRPISNVSWYSAARFANWMSNGQPTGIRDSTTTENGAYDVEGHNLWEAQPLNAINPNTGLAPTYRIPSENEWYKAAYFDPTKGGGGGYWTYATRSDADPGNVVGNAPNQANYRDGSIYSVTQSPDFSTVNYITDVGSYSSSASFYGTFDQSGNVEEWNDLTGAWGDRSVRGGGWGNPWFPSSAATLSSAQRRIVTNAGEDNWRLGFRLGGPVASTPVPEIDPAGLGSVLALVGSAIGLVERRRRG